MAVGEKGELNTRNAIICNKFDRICKVIFQREAAQGK